MFLHLLKACPDFVEQVSINTCPTGVFVEEGQVPVAEVAFVSILQFICLFQSVLYCGHSLMFR